MKGLNLSNVLLGAMLKGIGKGGYPVPLNLGNRIQGTPLSTRTVAAKKGKNRRRRQRQISGRQGIEINKADGGYKSVSNTNAVRVLVVNTYGRLLYKYDQSLSGFIPYFQLARNAYSTDDQSIDVTREFNLSPEMKDWKQASLEYLVSSISFTLDYNRIPKAGETIPKLLLWTDTDKIQVINPHLESNVMVLSMNTNGVKNYNTSVTRATLYTDHLGWIPSSTDWPARWELHVSAQDTTYLDRTNQETYYVFGTWKLSIRVKVRLQDSITGLNVRSVPYVDKYAMNSMVNQLQDKIELLEKKLEGLKTNPAPIEGEEEEREEDEKAEDKTNQNEKAF